MPDWTKSMQQTFVYTEVDPYTWQDKRELPHVISSNISRDLTNETLGSASIDSTDEYGEMYVRIYLKTIQSGNAESFSLGTFLLQTPHDAYNGRVRHFSYDAYTPLLELKGVQPDIGYYIPKDSNIVEMVNKLLAEYLRSPVVDGSNSEILGENFVAEANETWLAYISAMLKIAKCRLGFDDLSRVVILPDIEVQSMRPIWSFDDNNSSILYPDFTKERDLYGIPNVVQVVYTSPNNTPMYSEVVNDDENSEVSVASRGRRIIHRETSPSLNGQPTQEEIDAYARNLLMELSTLEYSVTYTHAYCPVNIGDCVLLNYKRAGIVDTKAKVVSQNITCRPGCPVEETATYTIRMWNG